MVYLSTVCVAPNEMQDQKKKKKNPCGEVFSEQPFGSNPSTLTFLSSIKHHLQKKERKKKNLREIQSRQFQFESGRKRNYSQCICFSGLFVSSVQVLPKLQITIKR
jgi:hypothetical protein